MWRPEPKGVIFTLFAFTFLFLLVIATVSRGWPRGPQGLPHHMSHGCGRTNPGRSCEPSNDPWPALLDIRVRAESPEGPCLPSGLIPRARHRKHPLSPARRSLSCDTHFHSQGLWRTAGREMPSVRVRPGPCCVEARTRPCSETPRDSPELRPPLEPAGCAHWAPSSVLTAGSPRPSRCSEESRSVSTLTRQL